MIRLRAIDLFAGIGGIRLGFEKAGFQIVYSNDIDKYACQTYKENFGEIDQRDISSVQSSEIPDFDVLLAGFPCQPFSMAGHQKGFQDPRGSMFFQLVRIIKEKKPKAFLLENVKNLKNHNKGETFKVILHYLQEELGYDVHYKVLNSKNFGLPQNRERIYIVGFRKPVEFEFPEGDQNSMAKITDILERDVPEHYFLSEKYYEGLVKHKERHKAKGSGFGFEILKPNGIAFALVVGNMGRERNLIQDTPRESFYKEGDDKAIARNYLGVRKLTLRECARLQGFPENFIIPSVRTHAYKQFGNTVSVPVIKEIAKKMKKYLLQNVKDYSEKSSLIRNNGFLPFSLVPEV